MNLQKQFLTIRVCYVQPSCSTTLFVFVYSTSVVFMLLHYLTTTPSFLCSKAKFHPMHFIYHSPSHSFDLPYSVSFLLLIIVHHFHFYHIWSHSRHISIQLYFHNMLRNTILLKGCARYIFPSLFCISKIEYFWNKKKCFLFTLKALFVLEIIRDVQMP